MINLNYFKNYLNNLFLSVVLFFAYAQANAVTYNLTSGSYPPCSTNSWSVSGTTYTCTGNGLVTLSNGDVLTSNTTITISADAGFVLSNNTIGSTTNNINLVANYGSIQSGNTNSIYGSITASSSNITLQNTTVSGAITTGGSINLLNGSVGGKVTSTNNDIISNGTNLSGGAQANSNMSITGGTISGAFVMSSNNAMSFSGVTMTSGSMSGASTINISNSSTIGSPSSGINITSNTGAITVSGSIVYGTLTAPNYSTVNVNNGASIYGTCNPNSTPANACQAQPPTCTTGFVGGITGSYFNNKTLTAPVVGTRLEQTIDFDWASGSSGVSGVASDNFSVRWDGFIRAPSTGSYTFQTTSDDGVRLWVNGQLVIDNWSDHVSSINISNSISLVAGNKYSIKMEYYENGGLSVAKLYWSPPGYASFFPISTQTGVTPDTSNYCVVPVVQCTNGLMGGGRGKYYNNTNLTGNPVGTRTDSIIDFNWGSASPGVTGVNSDNFSVGWDSTLVVPATGSYQFETYSDDGVRLWVNNQLVIDNWTYHSATQNQSSPINLTAGVRYPLRVEYFEGGGSAVMSLRWKNVSSTSFIPISGCPPVYTYFGISHSGTGVTCAAEPITITAYDSNNNMVAPENGVQVTLSSDSTNAAWVGGNTFTFDGVVKSFVKYLQQPTTKTVNMNVTDGFYTESASLDPNLNFVDSALKFYEGANPLISTKVSGTSSTISLKALRTDNNTGACVARITGTKAVSLGYVCRNPTSCVVGQTFSANSTLITGNANANLSSPTYTSVNLTFDNTGTAPLPVEYSDVGQVRLSAQLGLSASGNDPAINLVGSSNDFIVKPYTLAVSSVKTNAGSVNPKATSGTGAANRFVSAGTAFTINVESRNRRGAVTPNFGNETTSEKAIKLNLSLVYPVGGTATPITIGTPFTLSAVAGTVTSNNISWNQVGSFTVQPRLDDDKYLADEDIALVTTSETIGRIYPDHYRLTSSSVTNACSTFSYMSHPAILTSYTLNAESTLNTTVTNYSANYGSNTCPGPAADSKACSTFEAENNDDGAGAALGPRFSLFSLPSWNNGSLNLPATPASFNRAASVAERGPYPLLQIGLNLVDNFDGRSLIGMDMNPSTTGTCTTCTSVKIGSTINAVYGRLKLDDAFGPESVELPVNFLTEYWVGNRFIQNTSDSCTVVPRSAITYPSGSLSSDANRTVSLTGGATQGTYANLNLTGVNFTGGSAGQKFTAPLTGTGSFVVGVNLTSLPWLRWDWNQDGSDTDTSLPNANFGFGTYRGNDRIIYWREKLQ